MKTRSFAVCNFGDECQEGPGGVILDPAKGIIIHGNVFRADPENLVSLVSPKAGESKPEKGAKGAEKQPAEEVRLALCAKHALQVFGLAGSTQHVPNDALEVLATANLRIDGLSSENAKLGVRVQELENLLAEAGENAQEVEVLKLRISGLEQENKALTEALSAKPEPQPEQQAAPAEEKAKPKRSVKKAESGTTADQDFDDIF